MYHLVIFYVLTSFTVQTFLKLKKSTRPGAQLTPQVIQTVSAANLQQPPMAVPAAILPAVPQPGSTSTRIGSMPVQIPPHQKTYASVTSNQQGPQISQSPDPFLGQQGLEALISLVSRSVLEQVLSIKK